MSDDRPSIEARIRAITRDVVEVARVVGSQHAAWDVIMDAHAYLRGEPTILSSGAEIVAHLEAFLPSSARTCSEAYGTVRHLFVFGAPRCLCGKEMAPRPFRASGMYPPERAP